MLVSKTGDIFDQPYNNQTIICIPVNTVGVMGGGLALSFKQRYFDLYLQYKESCDKRELKIGSVIILKDVPSNQLFCMFPTKAHWRNPSTESYILMSLVALEQEMKLYRYESVAFPQVGCGLGGLEWDKIRLLVEDFSERNPEFEVLTYD